MKRPALIVISLASIAACGGSNQPASPSSIASVPSPSVPPPSGPPASRGWAPVPGGFRLSGTVVESTPNGSQPVSGGTLFFWIESRYAGPIAVDTTGRYMIDGVPVAPIIRLTWIPGPGQLDLHQPCPANVAMDAADTVRDIEVVRFGSTHFKYDSPTLSGMVYESTPDGRRPLPHTRVLFSMDDRGGFDAYSETDVNGRYLLCRIPQVRGQLGAGDCNDAVYWSPVQVNGDTVVDVDLRPFKERCP